MQIDFALVAFVLGGKAAEFSDGFIVLLSKLVTFFDSESRRQEGCLKDR
jgi:hypothetical protein